MISAAHDQAIQDRRLHPQAKVAHSFCEKYLDGAEWRKVKVEQVAHYLKCEKMSAVRALRALRLAGYIDRRRAGKGDPCEYRLLPAPLPAGKSRAA
jgi:hypothetical protein